MGRRSKGNELEFGSDSFLDIVANIVGILIILIVIAGVRVSQAPLPPAKPIQAPVLLATPTIDAVDPREHRPLLPTFAPQPPGELLARPASLNRPTPHAAAPSPPLPPETPAELVQLAAEYESELASLNGRASRLEELVQSTLEGQASLDQRRDEAQGQLQLRIEESSRAAEVVSRLQQAVESDQRELAELRVRLAESESAGPPAQVLRHVLTPVGRVVSGEELHFLLSEGRVAAVPVKKLSERLKSHIERQRDRLIKMRRYVGTIGPVDGFRMEYVIEQIPSSLLDDLRYGQHVIRVGVTQWQLIPEPDLHGESLEEALESRSEFLNQLRQTGPRDTVTFWVYPDSFELHRGLQEFAHLQGYQVAARPLPSGIPITGSPNGSQSIAQ